jgi:hypothetical protein
MKVDSYIYRMQKMSKMIEQRCTGSPCEFAEKMHMTKRSLFNALVSLREMVGKHNIHIIFSKQIHSYIYDQPGSFKLADSFWEEH